MIDLKYMLPIKRRVEALSIKPRHRVLNYEDVYLLAYESVHDARPSLGRSIEFYSQTRPHFSLTGKTPNQIHVNQLPEALAA